MTSTGSARYCDGILEAVDKMADAVNLADANAPAVTDIPAEWVDELDGYLSAANLKALIEAAQKALPAGEQPKRGVQKVLLRVPAEDTMLRVPVDETSIAKSCGFIHGSGLASLKETAEVYKEEISMVKNELGAREVTAVMKLGKIKKEEKEIKGKKKPKVECSVRDRAKKLGLEEGCIPQQDMDKFLVRCEENGAMFAYFDLLAAPVVPLDKGWLSPEALKKATAAKKVLKAGDDGEYMFADADDDTPNSKGVPLGLYLAGLQRWLTMLAVGQRIRLSSAYTYLSIILDLACSHSVTLAQAYDDAFRRKLAANPKWSLGELEDPSNRTERDALFRGREQAIIDRIVMQKTLTMAKGVEKVGASDKANADKGKNGKDKGKGKSKKRDWIPDHIWWGKGPDKSSNNNSAEGDGSRGEPEAKRQKADGSGAGGKN